MQKSLRANAYRANAATCGKYVRVAAYGSHLGWRCLMRMRTGGGVRAERVGAVGATLTALLRLASACQSEVLLIEEAVVDVLQWVLRPFLFSSGSCIQLRETTLQLGRPIVSVVDDVQVRVGGAHAGYIRQHRLLKQAAV